MKKRCEFPECKKAIPITSYACKCKKNMCLVHMNAHECTFDYQAEQRERLMKHMSSPVVGQKILPV
uniref:AN1-type domain-containing protein n=1 Tax=viral metagenome TaxID=1070528 RepID=A0A6C0DDC0_9ZZZZ